MSSPVLRFGFWFALLSFVGAASYSVAANADEIVMGTFSGTVFNSGNGVDEANLFGFGANANLSGQAFTGTLIYDATALGTPSVDGSISSSVWASAPLSDPLTITLTVNGHTFAIAGTQHSVVSVFQGCCAIDPAIGLGVEASTITGVGGPPYGYIVDLSEYMEYSSPPPITIASNIGDLGTVDFSSSELSTGAVAAAFYSVIITDPGYDEMIFSIHSFNVEPEETSVPEPTTLALFGAGLLGFAGFAVMRRRKTTTSA
jgi:hypothetical protein